MNRDDRPIEDETEERLRRTLSAVAGHTRAPDRWAEVAGRIGGDDVAGGGVGLADYVQEAGPPRRGSRVLVAMATVGVVLGAAFGVLSLSAGDGAGSPEEAVEDLFDAVAAEDAIGVLEAITPSERDLILPALKDLEGELKRLDVASSELDLRKVRGVDLEVGDVQTAVTPLSDDTAVVRVTGGRVKGALRLGDLPFGSLLSDLIVRDTKPPEAGTADVDGLVLVAVKEGGGWHVGLQASLGNAVHGGAVHGGNDGFPGPDLAGGIPAKGASTPEDAAREMIEAMSARDIRRMIELTPLAESRALHQWGPTFVAWSEENDFGQGSDIDQVELAVSDGPDGTKTVRLDHYRLRYRQDTARFSEVTYDGRCTSYSSTFPGDGGPDLRARGQSCGIRDPLSPTVDAASFGVLGFGAPPTVLSVVEHEGAWFVSPVRSLVATLLDSVRGLDREDAIRAVRSYFGQSWAALPADYWEACGVARPPADAAADEGEAAARRCSENLPEDYVGPFWPWFAGVGGGSAAESSGGPPPVGPAPIPASTTSLPPVPSTTGP